MASTRRFVGLGFTAAMIAALLVPVLAGAAPGAPVLGDRVGAYDPATSYWQLDGGGTFLYGNPGDTPFMGDWNCDGTDTPGLHRPVDTAQGPAGKVYLRNSNSTGIADVEYFFGDPGDVAFAGDFNGDGCDSVGLFRPATGQVFLTNLLGSANRGIGAAQVTYDFPAQGHDLVGARALAADFDGNGIDTVALHLPATATVLGARSTPMTFGDPGDQLVAGAFGGSADSLGVYRSDSFLLSDAPGDLTASAARSFSVGAGSVALSWSPSGTTGPAPRSGHPCAGPNAIVGTANADVINGTNGADVIDGLGGNDVIGGNDGNDTICGGDGDDILNGDQGNDTVYGDAGVDNVNGGDGNDTLHGGPGADIVTGDKDDDTMFGDGGADNMNGGSGNDFVDGGDGDDLISGATGDDTLLGRNGADVLNGGPGTDTCDLGADGATQSKCENDRPQAANDAYSTNEDTALNVAAPGVLGNDTDADPITVKTVNGSTANVGTATPITLGSGAKLTVNANGSFTYDPNGQFESLGTGQSATDSFTYTATDGPSTSDPATVTVTITGVDDPPVAVSDVATVTEDDPATAIDVLANDTDVDGGPKSIASVTQPANGTVAITGGGSGLTYQPDADYCNDGSPTDDFSYTLTPGSSSATVAVSVTCVDDLPVAVDDAAILAEDSGATPIDVLANDSDIDGGPKFVASVTQPANGAVVNNGTDVTYAPNANYCNDGSPTDDFTYTLNGGSTATVAVTVTCVDDGVDAIDDAYSTDANVKLVVAAPGLKANDVDPDGDATVVPFGDPDPPSVDPLVIEASGKLTFDPAGKYRYLGAGQSVSNVTKYTLTDGVNSDTASVTITINGVNDAPKANPQDVSGSNAIVITLTGSDPDVGTDLFFSIVSGPGAGTLSAVTQTPAPGDINSATVTYTPDTPGEADSFVFAASDGSLSATATVRINPPPEGDTNPPGVSGVTAEDDTVETAVDVPVTVLLLAASDAAGDLAFSIESGPTGGSLGTITPIDPDGPGGDPVRSAEVTYTPPSGSSGTFSFEFRAAEAANAANFDIGKITIEVAAATPPVVPDDPESQNITKTLEENENITFSLFEGVTSPGVEEVCNLPGNPCGRAAQVNARADVTDPSGDATNSTADDPANPDLISAKAGVTGSINNVAFEVRYVANGFNATTTRTGIVIDIDQNPNTGFPGVDAANNDSSLIGVEYLVNIGANNGANAVIRKWVSGNIFVDVDTVPATILPDGHYVNFDLGLLGGDDGQFNFKVTTQSQISPTPGFTGILDYMPNLGLAPGIVGIVDSPLRYTVLTLPANGTLLDAEGNAITVAPTILNSSILTYQAPSTAGANSFQWSVENTALLTSVATTNFNVLAAGTCESSEAFCDNGRS